VGVRLVPREALTEGFLGDVTPAPGFYPFFVPLSRTSATALIGMSDAPPTPSCCPEAGVPPLKGWTPLAGLGIGGKGLTVQ
jgi:hypothetical protein